MSAQIQWVICNQNASGSSRLHNIIKKYPQYIFLVSRFFRIVVLSNNVFSNIIFTRVIFHLFVMRFTTLQCLDSLLVSFIFKYANKIDLKSTFSVWTLEQDSTRRIVTVVWIFYTPLHAHIRDVFIVCEKCVSNLWHNLWWFLWKSRRHSAATLHSQRRRRLRG